MIRPGLLGATVLRPGSGRPGERHGGAGALNTTLLAGLTHWGDWVRRQA